MIDKLDHLVETGITALELMPLATSPVAQLGL
jgi:1,4-alpha-glucan branching enzyme